MSPGSRCSQRPSRQCRSPARYGPQAVWGATSGQVDAAEPAGTTLGRRPTGGTAALPVWCCCRSNTHTARSVSPRTCHRGRPWPGSTSSFGRRTPAWWRPTPQAASGLRRRASDMWREGEERREQPWTACARPDTVPQHLADGCRPTRRPPARWCSAAAATRGTIAGNMVLAPQRIKLPSGSRGAQALRPTACPPRHAEVR